MHSSSSETNSKQAAALQRDNEIDAQAVYRTLFEDKNAFREIMERYTPLFYSLVRNMGGVTSREQTEEHLQTIFMKLYESLDRFDRDRRFFSWAYTIAINYIRNQIKKRPKQHDVEYMDELDKPEGSTSYPNPEQAAIRAEANVLVEQAVNQLKPSYREVFTLRMLQGVSVANTASILGIPEGSVKTILHRAKREIRRQLHKKQWER
ncbi:MAG: RNA polymerase sigma factor [Spirochaetota bacterium]